MPENRGPTDAGLMIAALAVIGRGVDGPPLWVATALAVGAAVAATLHLLGEWQPRRVAWDRLPLPALAAFGSVGFAHLLPIPLLLVAAPAAWLLVALTIELELPDAVAHPAPPPARPRRRKPLRSQAHAVPGPHEHPFAVRCAVLGLAFLAFGAVGGLVPGGLAGGAEDLSAAGFVAVVLLDAAIGGLAGFRLVALDGMPRRQGLYTSNHYLALGGHLGGLLRAVGVPRYLGPALFVVGLYALSQLFEARAERAAASAAAGTAGPPTEPPVEPPAAPPSTTPRRVRRRAPSALDVTRPLTPATARSNRAR